jgi:autotransporter adhesin
VNAQAGTRGSALGQGAKATGVDSTAVGSFASATVAGGVALGRNASVTAGNSVALGTASLASRGAQTGYAGYALTVPQTSAGEVSVGAAGAERQITNVAAGSAATDAVNVSQLTAVNVKSDAIGSGAASALGGGASYDAAAGTVTGPTYHVQSGTQTNVGDALGALDTQVTTNTGDITDLGNTVTNLGNTTTTNTTDIAALQQNALQWNPALNGGAGAYDASHGGATPQKITNVAAGNVAAGSTDAVNGGQLAQVASVANAGWNVTTAHSGTGKATGSGPANVAPGATQTITAGDNIAIAQNGTDLTIATNPDLNVTSVTAGNTVIDDNGVTVAGGPNGTVSLGNVGLNNGGNTITNVAAGVNPTDAANVGQMNTAVAGAASAGMNFTGNDASAGTVHRDLGQALAIRGGATTAGTYSGGNVKTVTDPATGAINVQIADAPTFGGVTVNAGGTGKITGVADGTDANDAVNVSQLNGVANVAANAVQYDDAGHTGVTLGGAGAAAPVGLHNVADGTIAASSTDAVNGGQLNTTNQNVAGNATNIAQNTSDITNLTTGLGATNTNVTNLGNRVTTAEGNITTLQGDVTQNTTDIAPKDLRRNNRFGI